MQIIGGKPALILILLATSILASAQKDAKKYKEEAESFRKEVWAWEKPEFAVRIVPAELANTSKIVIARHFEINFDSKKKSKFSGLDFVAYRELTRTEIYREAVKVNDKSAIKDYSEFTYKQLEKFYGGVINNKTTIYMGIKVIKPDGAVKEINEDDIILTRDEKKEKEAKIAVPDLQVGDIVDYFIAQQATTTDGTSHPYIFSLFEDYPVLSYSIHCEIGKKYAAEYRCYNGAPDLEHSRGEDGANIFDVKKKNLPVYAESNLWTAPYLQLPIIRMNIMLGELGYAFTGKKNTRRQGEIYKNKSTDEYMQDWFAAVAIRKRTVQEDYSINSYIKDYYESFKKASKTMSPDSIAATLYYIRRFGLLPLGGIGDITWETDDENAQVYRFGEFLREEDFENQQVVILTPNSGPRLNEIMSSSEFCHLINIPGSKNGLFGMPDFFSPAFYVPNYYENIKQAITVDIKGRKVLNSKKFDLGTIDIPGTNADANNRNEKLDIIPLLSDGKLAITRKTTLKGHYKSDVQKELVLAEDYLNAELKSFGVNLTWLQELETSKSKYTKNFAEELKVKFDNARSKQKDKYMQEVVDWFGQDITDLADHKIENLGVRHTSPDFIYSSKFKMGGVLKKAGNNFIVEIGKLQGSPLKITPAQRKRTLDIYMPFARSLNTEILLQIPDGYTAEGVESLNKKAENETGYFISEAVSNGKTITIKVKKSYNHAFEPVGNWDKLLVFIDAVDEWSNAKILLKKK